MFFLKVYKPINYVNNTITSFQNKTFNLATGLLAQNLGYLWIWEKTSWFFSNLWFTISFTFIIGSRQQQVTNCNSTAKWLISRDYTYFPITWQLLQILHLLLFSHITFKIHSILDTGSYWIYSLKAWMGWEDSSVVQCLPSLHEAVI